MAGLRERDYSKAMERFLLHGGWIHQVTTRIEEVRWQVDM